MRLAELQTLDVFYTPLEERFERITRLAQRALSVPVAAVTLLGEGKQWFKSVAGWRVTELPMKRSLCNWTVEGTELLVVPDTQADSRFADHPLVQQRPRFRFYAGYPLIDSNGVAVGSFCIMDIKPRTLSSEDRHAVRDLAAMTQRELFTDQLTTAQATLTSKLGAARREAMIDPLTRLWNRRGATVLLRAALRQAGDLGLGVLDIDGFKRINDLHGHQMGDEALRKIAQVLISSMRDDDIICRTGGDEFLMIMTGTTDNQAAQILDRVRCAVSEKPIRTRGGPMRMSVSAGYAIRKTGHELSEKQLFQHADEALLRSKAAGRNCVRKGG